MPDGRVVAPCPLCQQWWGSNVFSFHTLTGGVEYDDRRGPTNDVAQDCLHCGQYTIIAGSSAEG